MNREAGLFAAITATARVCLLCAEADSWWLELSFIVVTTTWFLVPMCWDRDKVPE